ncbi:MAG: SpaA isopeptide-forming pilin-related protein, partial [Hungatella sp.]
VKDETDTVLGEDGKITNTLKTADITIQKQIEDFALSTPKSYQEHTKTPAGKFEFTLAGKTGSGRDFTKTHVVGAAEFAAGEVWFQAIPVGSYTLKETAHPDNYVALDPNEIAVKVAVEAGTAEVSYAGGTATKDPYVIRNDVYRNTIYAKKVTTLGQQNYPVAGAVFGLFDSANQKLASATSDGNGNLKFADVPCLAAPDTYYVKEISAPSGYTPDETHYVIAVTPQRVALSDGTAAGMAITESKPLLIHNAATLVSVKLKKINQNGDPIKGSEIPLNFTLTEKPVGGDRFKVTASNAEDGSVTFSGLRYGTYQLTEAASDHVTGEEQVTAEIEVSKGSGDQTKVSVTYNHQTRSMEQAAANPDFDFTADAALAIVNEVDYGLVQINKIVGSVNRDGSLTPVWEGNHVKPLAGAKFQVYVDTNRNGTADPGEYAQDKAVLTMVTGADGSFLMDEENRYLNSGLPQNYRLLYGEFYLLREISVSQGLYAASTAIYPFDMKKLTQTEQKLYVGADPKDVKITLGSMDGGTGDIVAKADAALIFPNGAAHRGSVKLVKQDQEDPDITLSGAEFDVYTDSGIRIGRLTDEHERGSYELAMGGTGYVKEDASGQRYLHDEGGTIMLLPGSYYIVETKAPKGYVLPSNAERWYFVMNNQADVIVTNPDLKTDATGTTAKALENHIARHHLAVQKYVQEALHTVTYHTAKASDPLTGIELQLEGFTINQEHYRVTKNLAQMMNADGIVTFEDIPSGTYTLTELHVPEQYQVPKPMQVVVDSDGIRMDDGERIGGAVRLNNDLKRGSIRGMKKASGDKPLAGAMIGLFPAGTTEFSEANLYAGLISVSDAA